MNSFSESIPFASALNFVGCPSSISLSDANDTKRTSSQPDLDEMSSAALFKIVIGRAYCGFIARIHGKMIRAVF